MDAGMVRIGRAAQRWAWLGGLGACAGLAAAAMAPPAWAAWLPAAAGALTLLLLAARAAAGLTASPRPAPSQAEQAAEALRRLAPQDALTGLPGQPLLLERLAAMLAGSERNGPVTVLAIEFLNHPTIVRQLGSIAGDLLLRHGSARLLAHLRQSDVLIRAGRARFAVLLGVVEQPEHIVALCARLEQAMAKPFDLYGQPAELALCFGAASHAGSAAGPGQHAQQPALLLEQALAALDQAIEDGAGTVCGGTEPLATALRQHAMLAADLRGALERGELEVRYEPQFSLPDRRLVGVEALPFWHHPTQGVLPPERFLPLAEQIDAAGPIGAWLLRASSRQVAAWRQERGLALELSVALTATQLGQPGLAAVLLDELAAAGLDCDQVTMTISEAVLARRPRRQAALLAELRRRGLRVAIADFGGLHGALTDLAGLDVDQVVVDLPALAGRLGEAAAAALLRAVGTLCRELHCEFWARAIASEQAAGQAAALGCQRVQGRLFSPPTATLEMAALVAASARPASAAAGVAAVA
jgi:diguanylate cyclase (GGDEF)-like protein